MTTAIAEDATFEERAQAVDQAEAETAEGRLARLRAALVDSAGLDLIPEPEPLVPGVLYRDSLAWLYGAPGCGKSFIAIDLAGCIGTGEVWQGFGPTPAMREGSLRWGKSPVAQGTVLYLVAEGVSGVKQRVRAWEASMGQRMAGVQFLPVAVQASNGSDWAAFVELARELEPALIVVDTQARVTVGMEENSAKEMGEFVHRVEQLRVATRACVLVVHHTGRGGEHMRGSIAMDGAATTLLKVEKAEEYVTIECTKQKDTQEFDPIRLRMVPYEASAILSLIEGPPTVDIGQTAVRRALTDWWNSHETDWVSASVLIESKIFSKATFYRSAKSLERAGLVEVKGGGSAKRFRLTREPS